MNRTTEPVAFDGTIQSALLIIIAALTAFGVVTLTDVQITAVLGLAAVANVVWAQFTRKKVTPVASAPPAPGP